MDYDETYLDRDIPFSGQVSNHRLAQQARQQVARVLATPQARQRRTSQITQVKNFVQLAIGQEPGVRRDLAAVKFQLQAMVEIDPQMRLSGFTRRVTGGSPVAMMVLH